MIMQTQKLSVNDLMVTDLITVKSDTSLRHVLKLMQKHGCRQFPVVDGGQLVGIITDRDMRLALNEPSMHNISWGNETRLDRLVAKDYMSKNPLTVSPEMMAYEAAELMSENKFGALPVVENSNLVGIITVTDFLDNFSRQQRNL